MKKCQQCQLEKPVSDFNREERNADQLSNKCKGCRKAGMKQVCHPQHSSGVAGLTRGYYTLLWSHSSQLIVGTSLRLPDRPGLPAAAPAADGHPEAVQEVQHHQACLRVL